MNPKLQIRGLWVPLITPCYEGKFDEESLVNLIEKIEPYVDGLVPCLSSGEGRKMSNEFWAEMIEVVRKNTTKPLAAGILRTSLEEIVSLSKKAKKLGCIAIVTPIQGNNDEEHKDFCRELSLKTALPVMIYNTETVHVADLDVLKGISANEKIVAIKDSSQNQQFFNEMTASRVKGELGISVFQGMENQLLESCGCDGYLISLANAEPKLCREMFDNPSMELNEQIMQKWEEFNLVSDTWYIGVKEALASGGIIRSSELIK